jgi:hypothetical protein
MTVQLDWPPEVIDRVTAEARQKGLSLDEYILKSVLYEEPPTAGPISDDDAKREARIAAGRSIRELSKGIILGPDLTIRDLIEEGRRF